MRKSMPAWALLLASALGPSAALAIEGGALPIYPDGLKTTWSAPAPPGVHFLTYGGALRYDTLRGNSGESLVRDFKVNVNMLAPRLICGPSRCWRQPGAARSGAAAGRGLPRQRRALQTRAWATSPSARRWLSRLAGAALSVRRRCLRAHGQVRRQDPSSLGKNY